MSALYLLEGECGEYDDWGHWTLGVFSSRAKAKAAIGPGASEARWHYDARTRASTTTIKSTKRYYDDVMYTIRPVEVDTPL